MYDDDDEDQTPNVKLLVTRRPLTGHPYIHDIYVNFRLEKYTNETICDELYVKLLWLKL